MISLEWILTKDEADPYGVGVRPNAKHDSLATALSLNRYYAKHDSLFFRRWHCLMLLLVESIHNSRKIALASPTPFLKKGRHWV